MIANPRLGQPAQLWYRASLRRLAPHHGKVGTVAVRGAGRPRNHGILIGGALVVVPCGNLRVPAAAPIPPLPR